MSLLSLLLFVIHIGCISPKPRQQDGRYSINGNWQLIDMYALSTDPGSLFPDKQPYLRLDSSTLQASGSTGCNRFSGQFVAVNRQFRFDMNKMILTRMACKGPGEGIFLEALGRVTRYRLQNDTLLFLANDSVLFRWKKKN